MKSASCALSTIRTRLLLPVTLPKHWLLKIPVVKTAATSNACDCCSLSGFEVELFLGSKGSAPYVRNIFRSLNTHLSRPGQPPLLSDWRSFASSAKEAVKTRTAYPAPEAGGTSLAACNSKLEPCSGQPAAS